jgi:hypothetical protein
VAPPISFYGGKVPVHRLREPAQWLKSLALIASASVRPDLVRQFFPTLEHKAPPAPALPHQTVRQYLGAFGKSAISRKKIAELVIQVRFEAVLGRSVLVATCATSTLSRTSPVTTRVTPRPRRRRRRLRRRRPGGADRRAVRAAG